MVHQISKKFLTMSSQPDFYSYFGSILVIALVHVALSSRSINASALPKYSSSPPATLERTVEIRPNSSEKASEVQITFSSENQARKMSLRQRYQRIFPHFGDTSTYQTYYRNKNIYKREKRKQNLTPGLQNIHWVNSNSSDPLEKNSSSDLKNTNSTFGMQPEKTTRRLEETKSTTELFTRMSKEYVKNINRTEGFRSLKDDISSSNNSGESFDLHGRADVDGRARWFDIRTSQNLGNGQIDFGEESLTDSDVIVFTEKSHPQDTDIDDGRTKLNPSTTRNDSHERSETILNQKQFLNSKINSTKKPIVDEVKKKSNFKPRCSSSKRYCEFEDEYPNDLVASVLSRSTSPLEFRKFFGDEPKPHDEIGIASRADFDEEGACVSRSVTIYPKAAKSRLGKFLYVVNDDKYAQAVKVEECFESGKKCLEDISFLGKKYFCRQKYVYSKLFAITEDGHLTLDSFQVPSCCSCSVQTLGAHSKQSTKKPMDSFNPPAVADDFEFFSLKQSDSKESTNSEENQDASTITPETSTITSNQTA